MLRGWAWGAPRRGHPEGAVGRHVADLLETIDRWGETDERREDLRFISLVHDSLKYAVSPFMLRVGENHHAMRARRFAEGYTNDERLLATIELHDRPYHLWRGKRYARWPGRRYRLWRGRRSPNPRAGRGLDGLIPRLPDVALFVRFVELDGSTEGKTREPILWLKEQLEARGVASSPQPGNGGS
ncbi:MAG TPA: hypothetical protein VE270_05460 [Thermoleophilaceae bacterium]|nr:hypothetical protein [Thermoleophilaceae bacterium]